MWSNFDWILIKSNVIYEMYRFVKLPFVMFAASTKVKVRLLESRWTLMNINDNI